MRRRKYWQSGSILIMTALMIPVICALSGFVVDVGYAYMAKSKLQNAADASALAGGWSISYGREVREKIEEYTGNNLGDEYTISQADTFPDKQNDIYYTYEVTSDSSNKRIQNLTVTLRSHADTHFLRLMGIEEVPIKATAKVEVQVAGFNDEMFNYAMVSTQSMNFQREASVFGNIRTNNKISIQAGQNELQGYKWVYNSWGWGYWEAQYGWSAYKNILDGKIDSDIPASSIWANTTSDGSPSTFYGKDGNTSYSADNIANAKEAIDIDPNAAVNASMREFLQKNRDMSSAERAKNHVLYDVSGYHGSRTPYTYIGGSLDPGGYYGSVYKTMVITDDLYVKRYQQEHSVYTEPTADDYDVYVSLGGSIHMTTDMSTNFHGILYAPNGTVYLDGPWQVTGSIVAKNIVMNSTSKYAGLGRQSVTYNSFGFVGIPGSVSLVG